MDKDKIIWLIMTALWAVFGIVLFVVGFMFDKWLLGVLGVICMANFFSCMSTPKEEALNKKINELNKKLDELYELYNKNGKK